MNLSLLLSSTCPDFCASPRCNNPSPGIFASCEGTYVHRHLFKLILLVGQAGGGGEKFL